MVIVKAVDIVIAIEERTRASRGMRMTRDVRETDALSFRFADEGDVQLYARG